MVITQCADNKIFADTTADVPAFDIKTTERSIHHQCIAKQIIFSNVNPVKQVAQICYSVSVKTQHDFLDTFSVHRKRLSITPIDDLFLAQNSISLIKFPLAHRCDSTKQTMSNESNPVSLLQEHCTRQRYICKYLFKREGPDHAPLYHASVDVDGLLFDADTPAPTKAAAKRLAALSALNYLQQNIRP